MSPEIREAQLFTSQRVPKTAMAVTVDVGNAADIHPKQKEPVGARLALGARALAYGENIEYSGPVFKSMQIKDGLAILSFAHLGGGLTAQGGALKGFTIAGANPASPKGSVEAGRKFVPARAEIVGDQIQVSSAEVSAPVAVRYGWDNVPDVNLFNRAALPASPFRTDAD